MSPEKSELLSAFERRLRERGAARATIETYLGAARRFARWWKETTGEKFDPAAVTVLDVADYRRHLLNAGKKPSTVNLYLDAVSALFAWASGEGLAQSDPADGVRRLPEERTLPRWLTKRELGALLRALQKHGSPRDRALVALLLHAGLRVSEAVSLRVQDAVIRERSGHVKVQHGKGGKHREVPLNVTARKLLSAWLERHPGGEWLFPGKSGPMTPRAVQKRLKELGRLAGVDVTPHRLRHTFCKMLVDAGESLDRVALLAGHASLDTTAVYTKPGRADLERAVEKLSWE